jgi:hypothetical protein
LLTSKPGRLRRRSAARGRRRIEPRRSSQGRAASRPWREEGQ